MGDSAKHCVVQRWDAGDPVGGGMALLGGGAHWQAAPRKSSEEEICTLALIEQVVL